MREHRDFCILSEQLLQIVLKLVRLPLGERQIIVVSHVFTLPKLLKHLPLLLDAQPLGHRISQQGRLSAREERLIALIHVPRLLRFLPKPHRLLSSKHLRQTLCLFKTIYSPLPREKGYG